MNELTTGSVADTQALAQTLLNNEKADREGATVWCLHGDLGAGKTTFTQGLARALGIEASITSPTFVIEKIYDLPTEGKFDRLIHIDAYRLKSGDELQALGFDRLLADPKNLIAIEWPEQVASALPGNCLNIHFTFVDEQTRLIKYGS